MPTSADPQQVPARAEPTQAPAPAQDQGAAAAVPASAWGLLEDGSFKARLGTGLTIAADLLESGQIDLSTLPNPVPGLALKTATFRRSRLDINADVAVPGLDEAELTVRVNADGDATIRGRASRQLNIPALGNPNISLSLNEEGAISGSVTVGGVDMAPSIPGLAAEGGGTLSINDGKVSGDGNVTLNYRDLGNGTVNFDFGEAGAFSANGTLTITPPFADEITADISGDSAGNLSAEATISTGALSTPIPGLELNGGTITVGYDNGDPSLSVADFTATYRNLGTVTISSASLGRDRRIAGNGGFEVNLPAMDPVVGTLSLANGAVSGSVTLSALDFPDGLPITSGSITGTLSENGTLGFNGTVGVNLGPAGSGALSASYSETGDLAIGAEVDLTVPGLQGAHVSLAYVNGDIEGEAQVPIDTVALPGLGGEVTVRFAEGRWSGETEISYSADNGKLSGTIRVTLAQTEEGSLQVGGGGSVTAQLMPRLAGTLEATILPEGGIDISGAIEVTEPLELFPEKRLDKELFKYSQNIPLWAMLVAVIRVRAGIRAGIGPGVFRNIRVEGSYTIGADEADPTFSISGEMYIPAFAEAYVAFGAGLGLDVVLGSLTGGIEGVATAGVYGAISVVPELNYADGDWSIEGVATMAAGARLTLGLNAWAEIEALFVTVWEREWKLAEHVMSVGPDLALQAKMNYVFGSGEAPELEMTTSDIDTDKLIQDAMPKDGPGPSGAREALKNKAEWKGALKEKREAEMPPEVENAGKPGKPPEPAARSNSGGTQGKPPKSPADPNSQGTAKTTDPSQPETGPGDPTVSEKDAAQRQGTRYPKPVTLKTLDEAPAPTPRTMEQKKEDLRAAAQVAKLAGKTSETTKDLDDYFPKIKQRFQLKDIGYQASSSKGVYLRLKINPEITITEATEEVLLSDDEGDRISDTAFPNTIKGRTKTVSLNTQPVISSKVGVSMSARIGPHHHEGEGTDKLSGATGKFYDSFERHSSRPATMRYVAGHLLSRYLSGKVNPENLFPITAHANSFHDTRVETPIMNWVHTKKFYVDYDLDISIDRKEDSSTGKPIIDATITANAAPLKASDLQQSTANKLPTTVITSKFQEDQSPHDGEMTKKEKDKIRTETDKFKVDTAPDVPKLESEPFTDENTADLQRIETGDMEIFQRPERPSSVKHPISNATHNLFTKLDGFRSATTGAPSVQSICRYVTGKDTSKSLSGIRKIKNLSFGAMLKAYHFWGIAGNAPHQDISELLGELTDRSRELGALKSVNDNVSILDANLDLYLVYKRSGS